MRAKQSVRTVFGLWVCIGPTGVIDYDSLASKRKNSIKKCVDYKKEGWKCIKVDVNFQNSPL